MQRIPGANNGYNRATQHATAPPDYRNSAASLTRNPWAAPRVGTLHYQRIVQTRGFQAQGLAPPSFTGAPVSPRLEMAFKTQSSGPPSWTRTEYVAPEENSAGSVGRLSQADGIGGQNQSATGVLPVKPEAREQVVHMKAAAGKHAATLTPAQLLALNGTIRLEIDLIESEPKCKKVVRMKEKVKSAPTEAQMDALEHQLLQAQKTHAHALSKSEGQVRRLNERINQLERAADDRKHEEQTTHTTVELDKLKGIILQDLFDRHFESQPSNDAPHVGSPDNAQLKVHQ